MPEETQVITDPETPPVVVPEPASIPAPPKPPVKLRKVIQPTDREGHPIGAPHVYEADTQEELIEKISAGVANGTRKIRELTLGTPVEIKAPEGSDLIEEIPEFKPRELTADEKFALAAKFRDPATIDEAFDELYAARTGGKPQDFAKVQTRGAMDSSRTRANAEANAFIDAHPEFVPCEANSQVMMTYLTARKMALTVKNFEIAFKALNADGLLVTQEPEPEVPVLIPKREPEPPPIPPRTEEPAPSTPVPETRTRGTADLPSAITRTDSTPSGSVKSGRPSARAVAMMTSKQLKEALEKWPDLLTKR